MKPERPPTANPDSARLVEGSTARHLASLTIPMFLGISSMFIASLIDTIYVGWLGSAELAAVSFSFPLIMGLTTLSMGIGVGAASIIARLAGGGDRAPIRRLSTHALLLAALLSAILSTGLYISQEPVFRTLGADAEILRLIRTYISVWMFGLPFFVLPMVATMMMRALGNARLPGLIMGGSAVLQVALAPPLIFGMPGYADGLGLPGAAWAFVLSRLIIFAITWAVLRRMQLIEFRIPNPAALWASWREVLAIGAPSALNNLIAPASLAVTVALLAAHSHAVVAGFGIASRIESLAIMLLMALSASTGPFVGQNWGAGRHQRIQEAHKLAYRFALAYSLVVCLVLALWGRPIVAAIINDAPVVDAAYAFLAMVPVSYGLLGVGMIAAATFTALGNPMPALALSLGRLVVFYVPLALLGDRLFGYLGIYGAAALANLIIGGLSAWWLRRHLQRRIPTNLPTGVQAPPSLRISALDAGTKTPREPLNKSRKPRGA